MTYREARQHAIALLSEHGIEDASSDTDILLEAICHMRRMDLLLSGDRLMPASEKDAFLAALEKRTQHIPVQHITGEQYFCGSSFFVNGDVLIPRQETELLVRLASEKLDELEKENTSMEPITLLDLCTGSGCIGISLKTEHPQVQVTLSDLSPKALAVARKNADLHDTSVSIHQGDLFEGMSGLFDMIVSNPPYIASEVIETLQEEVSLHDPRMALDGFQDGLHFYRRIAAEGGRYLREGGQLLMEIGYDQADDLRALLAGNGWTHIRVYKDLAGLDRVVTAQKG